MEGGERCPKWWLCHPRCVPSGFSPACWPSRPSPATFPATSQSGSELPANSGEFVYGSLEISLPMAWAVPRTTYFLWASSSLRLPHMFREAAEGNIVTLHASLLCLRLHRSRWHGGGSLSS